MAARLQVKPRGTDHRIPPRQVGNQLLVPFAPMGINLDHPPEELGPEAWSNGRGVLFRNDAAERQGGEVVLADVSQSAAPFGPQHLVNVQFGPNTYWLYSGAAGIGVWDGVNAFDISPTTPPAVGGTPERWTSAVLNNLPVLNLEGVSPWFWNIDTGAAMLELPGWPASTSCAALRAFKYHLIAMNITAPGGAFDTQLLWSNSADPGLVPTEWAATPENDAGETIIAATPGALVDGLALRDQFVICKQHSTYLMQYIGGNFVFLFRKALVTSGALATNCMTEVLGRLLILTDGDVVLFDGQETHSLLENRFKRALFRGLDGDTYRTSFVVSHPTQSEVWVCVPETGSPHPNIAAVWDRNTDSWGIRSLFPETTYIGRGIIPDTGVDPTWDGDAQAWDLDDTRWNQSTFNPTDDGLLQGDEPGLQLIQVDEGLTHHDGSDIEGRIGKDSMPFDDLHSRKICTALWPYVIADQAVELTVRVGFQDRYSDPIRWLPEQTFNPATDERVPLIGTGRYISVHFSSRSATRWRLSGFALQVGPAGKF